MLFSWTCLWLLFTLFCTFCYYNCKKPPNFPPGPPWLPFFGCLPLFQKLRKKHDFIYEVFEELSETYGSLFGLKFGKQKVVVITSHDLVKKALVMEEFNGRPDGYFFKLRSFGKRKGVLFTDGPKWAQHRKFIARYLKYFSCGQTLMNERLIEEAKHLVLHIKERNSEGPIPMHTFFSIPVLNVLWAIFAGYRFNYDHQIITIVNLVHDAFRLMDNMGGIMSHMPFLRYICPKLCGYTEIITILNKLINFLEDEVQKHEENLHNVPQDFIDAFLIKMQELKATGKPTDDSIFEREELLIICLDLFMAGSETSSSTLSTMFLYLGLNPKWLKILQSDLEEAIGRHRPPTINDKSSLPRIEAFIAEIQRVYVLAPLGIPHRTLKDVWLGKYKIPAVRGTTTLFSYHSVAHDKTYWKNPEEFQPDRFLDEQGYFKGNNSIPFGLGKRRCLGEDIARENLFMFLTTIIHYYDCQLSSEHEKPDMKGCDGFAISPKPYYLIFKLRDDVTL